MALACTYCSLEVNVDDSFLEEYANKYIEQRKGSPIDLSEFDTSFLFDSVNFETGDLERIIQYASVARDVNRESGGKPIILNDIYRSDLGELFLTTYFEDILEEKEGFMIPAKNLAFRELEYMPGRGIDAIGYRYETATKKIHILLGEAKVSSQKKNPPSVVDASDDSIYQTHLGFKNNDEIVIRRLSDYQKRLQGKDRIMINGAILSISNKKRENFTITHGCVLVRDSECCNTENDYGKMKINSHEFDPNLIYFSIIKLNAHNISDTADLFYNKVQSLIA